MYTSELEDVLMEHPGVPVPREISFVQRLPLAGIGKTDKKRRRSELTG